MPNSYGADVAAGIIFMKMIFKVEKYKLLLYC